MMQNLTDSAYQTHILQGVSRTFALTIPQLPEALHRVIGNGYLLCRIADTIEDEPQLTAVQKRYFSQEWVRVIAGETAPLTFSKALFPLLSDKTLPAEKDLIANTSRVIRLTHQFTPRQQTALLRCVKIMTQGMSEFQQNSTPNGLKNLAEMDRYCYHVAGVVGEMLTTLFCDYSPFIAHHEVELHSLAVSFGQGLQMTNILKDLWEDHQRGACWLPQDIFAENGFDLRNLSPHHYDPALGEGLSRLIGIACHHLHHALQYILFIPRHESGIRRFCLWALGMALLTLRRIHQHLDFHSGQQVKISRRWVKATIFTSNLSARHDNSLRLLFYLLTRSLPSVKNEYM
ncbi:MAG: phytoene synthase [Beggiatoa sp. IS2]|nr:MAG: phytoene synthase [Beggiatoa sp. IS2]